MKSSDMPRIARALVDLEEVNAYLDREEKIRLNLLQPRGIRQEEILMFKAGDLIEVYELVDYGWWRGKLLPNGPEGYFDQIHVEVLEEGDPGLIDAPTSSAAVAFKPPPRGRFGIQSILEAIDLELEILHQKWGDESSLQALQRVRAQTLPYKTPPAVAVIPPPATATRGAGGGAGFGPNAAGGGMGVKAAPEGTGGAGGGGATGVGRIQMSKLPKPPPTPPKPVVAATSLKPGSSPPQAAASQFSLSSSPPNIQVYPTARAKTALKLPPKAQTLHAPPSKSTSPPTPPSVALKPLNLGSPSTSAAAAAAPSPKARPMSPENWKAKFQVLEHKLRGDPESQATEEARERKTRFIARMDFLKIKKAQLTKKQHHSKMRKSKSMDSFDKLAISHIVVSQPVSIPMDWPAHNNKGKAPETATATATATSTATATATATTRVAPPPPNVATKPKLLNASPPPPVPEKSRDRSKSAAAIQTRPTQTPSPPPPTVPQKPLPPPKPQMKTFPIPQPNRTSFLCETQIEPPPPPPKPKNIRLRRNSIDLAAH